MADQGEQSFSGILDGLEIRLEHIFKKNSLLIELSHPQDVVIYRARLTDPDEIRNVTEGYLQRALQPNPPWPLKFRKDEEALIFTCKPFYKRLIWKITLHNVKQRVEDKLDFLLRKSDELSAITMHPVFVTKNEDNFEFSADNKQCTKLHNDSDWEYVIGNPKFFHRGKQQFSIKIMKMTPDKRIFVCLLLVESDQRSNEIESAWLFHLKTGEIFAGRSYQSYFKTKRVPIIVDDIITCVWTWIRDTFSST